jgi:hypothetical protein
MENSKIIVSNPCNKDWNKMTNHNNGKYCGSCNKTVIDFTTWDVEDIKKYLLTKNEHICGHFKTLQAAVKRPKHHQFLVDLYLQTDTKIKTPYFKALVLSLIIFCMTVVGCNTPPTNTEASTTNIESGEDTETLTGVIPVPEFIDSTNKLEAPPIDSITGSIDPEIADSIR